MKASMESMETDPFEMLKYNRQFTYRTIQKGISEFVVSCKDDIVRINMKSTQKPYNEI